MVKLVTHTLIVEWDEKKSSQISPERCSLVDNLCYMRLSLRKFFEDTIKMLFYVLTSKFGKCTPVLVTVLINISF